MTKKTLYERTKQKAIKVFSQYIRKKYANKYGYVNCVTCGVLKHWKEIQCGHFIDGRMNSVLFNENLCHPQCFRCNFKSSGCLAGNKVKYTIFMMNKYNLNKEAIDELDNLKFQTKKYTLEELENIVEVYTEKSESIDV